MKNNSKKIKTIKYYSEEQKEIFKFVVILGAILIIVGIMYLFSTIASNKNTYHYDESTKGSINYDVVTVGTMFNRSEDEYYVAIYDADSSDAIYYASVLDKYKQNPEATKVYFCNLANKLNADYIASDGKSNPKAKTINDVAFSDFTFVKIKNGTIDKYLENISDVKRELGIEK